ncbi:MAG TPA: hypothetical protein VGI32_04600 [Steroidobacteraceae bacterium]
MILLNRTAAVVSPEKLRDYLLSPTHPIGRYKAQFFGSLGYDQNNWQTLDRDLRALLLSSAEPLQATKYGQKYAVAGSITGPNGRVAEIVAVWIILAGEEMPRFVTAYPKD